MHGDEASPSFVRETEGNGVAERFIRTLKENRLWVRTFDTHRRAESRARRVRPALQRNLARADMAIVPQPSASDQRWLDEDAVDDLQLALSRSARVKGVRPALLRTYRPELSEVTAAANLPCARRCAPRTRTCRSLCPLNSSSCAPPAPNPLAGRGRMNQSFSERSILPPHP